ncbi:MAG TPA: GNAT family N-acetyltransferase, partial [Chitinophaga sp.]|nr:GNAT family N-acetyltransferase [Chitinophaga sp.]
MTPQQLEQAEMALHREVYSLITDAQQGDVVTKDGLVYTWSSSGPQPGGMVLVDGLTNEQAGPLLDEMMAWYRIRKAKGMGVWSLHPTQPDDLGSRLLARGFSPGWHPGWMSRDLETIPSDYPIPSGIDIRADNESSTHAIQQLPYNGNNGVISDLFMQTYPDRTQRFLAFKDDKIVGQSCVLLTTGENAIAGIFNVGVIEAFRKQGIGKALVLSACRWAKERGYHYALLNATGRRMYEQAGFTWISFGHTWWMNNDRYITHSPSQNDVLLAEAVCKGELDALDRLAPLFSTDALNTPTANGMTLMELAIHCRQTEVANWLVQHGVQYTAYDAWQLRWKDRVAALLAGNPQEVNRT